MTGWDGLDGRRIGPHLPLAAGLTKAVERAGEIGATAIQIFSDNPTAWRRKEHAPPDLAHFRVRLRELGIGQLAIHAPYLINLCGPDEAFWEKSVATIVSELAVGAEYGASFVNLHIGSHRGHGRAEGLRQLAAGLREVLRQAGDGPDVPLLVLENSAGGGDGIGSSTEDLVDILEAAARAGVDVERLGLCLDTAHLWGAGHDIGDPDALDALLDRLDRLVGAERLAMIHLNDARTDLGSRLDRHEHIGAGAISRRGLRHLLTHPRLADVPIYLETPGMDTGYDAVNMDRVRLLLADEELPELPPEAFTLRGARSRMGSLAPPGGSPATLPDA